MENQEKLQQGSEKPYEGYVILGIGEGGGNMGRNDKPISKTFSSVAKKIENGAIYLSLEKLAKGDSLLLDDHYDIPFKERLTRYVDNSKRSKGGERRFIVGDANKLPLPDNSVNEIWVENVFGDSTASLSLNTLKEITRVLSPKGELFVLEIYTPGTAAELLNMDFESELGLSKVVYQGDALSRKLSELGVSPEVTKFVPWYDKEKSSFLVIFTKLEAKES